jgi:hypothetical protein
MSYDEISKKLNNYSSSLVNYLSYFKNVILLLSTINYCKKAVGSWCLEIAGGYEKSADPTVVIITNLYNITSSLCQHYTDNHRTQKTDLITLIK